MSRLIPYNQLIQLTSKPGESIIYQSREYFFSLSFLTPVKKLENKNYMR